MSDAPMPSFSNFAKFKPSTANETISLVPTVPLPPASESSHRRKDKSRRRDDESRRSHRHKDKSRHKRHKRHGDSDSSSEDDIIPLNSHQESRKVTKLKEEMQSTGSASGLYSIRRMGDQASYKHRSIHPLDRPDYHKAYMGALGTNPNLYISWSADLKSFEMRRKAPRREAETPEKRKIKPFEGRYCAKGAVSSVGQSIRKKTAAELENEAKAFGTFVIPIRPAGDNASTLLNSELEEQEAVEKRFLQRNKELNSAVSKDPRNVDAWLSLINFQDEMSSLVSGNFRKNANVTTGGSKVVLERKLDMFAKAISHNPNDIDLIVGRFETLGRLHDANVVNAEWAKEIALRTDSAPLWLAYLRFVQSNFNHFSISHFRTVYSAAIRYLNRAKLNFLDALLEFEGCLAELLIRAATVEFQAGYRERAIAIFQATLEINFSPPEIVSSAFNRVTKLQDAGHLTAARSLLLSNFAAFWESGLPRFGEKDAHGWKHEFNTHDYLKPSIEVYDPLQASSGNTDLMADEGLSKLPSQMTDPATLHDATRESDDAEESITKPANRQLEDTISYWTQLECDKDELNLFPLRPDQMVDDIESVVLFEDIKDVLIYFSHPEAKNFIFTSFFELIGVHLRSYHSSNSTLTQTRLLEYEDLHEVFFILEKSKYPKMASVSYSEGEIHSGSMPDLTDLLDSRISPSIKEGPLKQLARQSLEQACSMELSTEMMVELKTLRVLLDGDAMAKQLLQADQENLVLWNAYVRLLTSQSEVTKPMFVRRTYAKVIQSFAQDAFVIQAVKRAAEWEYRQGYPSKALEALLLMPEASTPPSSSDSLEDRLHRASAEYKHRLTAFQSGVMQTIASIDPLFVDSSPLITELLDVFFDLSIVCALLDGLREGPSAFEGAFTYAKEALSLFSVQSPSLSSKVAWYSERFWMHQLGYLALEYERKSIQVPMGVLRDQLTKSLALFPSNPYLLSLFVIVSHRSRLLAQSRRFFDTQLLLTSRLASNTRGRLLLWLFSARSEIQSGAHTRIRRQLERSIAFESKVDAYLPQSVLIWKLWLEAEKGRPRAAKALLFRAMQACPWNKSVIFSFLRELAPYLSTADIEAVKALMETKEIRLRSQPKM